MSSLKDRTGFTLLEIIIVIIIVGVLASLALPRFFSTVEYSRSTEAMNALGIIRESVFQCGIVSNNVVGCDNFSALEIDDPGLVPGSHFSYAIAVTGANAFTVTATRNTVDGGTSGDLVELSVSGTGTSRSGTTAFASIK